MGKIFYVMGKSACGKDSLCRALKDHFGDRLKEIVGYTTRPIRDGEQNGKEYLFVDAVRLADFEKAGKLIESRTYQTVYGPWTYATVDDGQVELEKNSYLMMGTLASYEGLRRYFGADALVPLYIELEDGLRLERAIGRERKQEVPKYTELCRRFLADTADFSEEELQRLGLTTRYENVDFEECLGALIRTVEAAL